MTSERSPAPSLPAPPRRTNAKPPTPPQVDVGSARVTVVLDDGERFELTFMGDRNGPDPFDPSLQWVTTAKEQVDAWLAFSAKKGVIRLKADTLVPWIRVQKIITDYQPHLVSARRF